MERPFVSVEETDDFAGEEAEADTLPPEAPDTLRPSAPASAVLDAFLQAERACWEE